MIEWRYTSKKLDFFSHTRSFIEFIPMNTKIDNFESTSRDTLGSLTSGIQLFWKTSLLYLMYSTALKKRTRIYNALSKMMEKWSVRSIAPGNTLDLILCFIVAWVYRRFKKMEFYCRVWTRAGQSLCFFVYIDFIIIYAVLWWETYSPFCSLIYWRCNVASI